VVSDAAPPEERLPSPLRPLFWDVDPEGLDLERHRRFVLERILEFGDQEAVAWAWRRYGPEAIKETVEASRRLSPKTRTFWETWFRQAGTVDR
jgi:hypothetical protein